MKKDQQTTFLRPATLLDNELIFKWRNDPVVRQNSLNSDVIAWKSHSRWFKDKLKQSQNSQIFILERTDGTPVGQIRFDKHGTSVSINYSVDTHFRGQGLGSILVRKGIRTMLGIWKDITLFRGLVKMGNIPSQAVFKKNKFIAISKGRLLEFRKMVNSLKG